MENNESVHTEEETHVSQYNSKGIIEDLYASSEYGTVDDEHQEVGNEIGSESGVEPDYAEWVFDDKERQDDILFELTTEQAMATLRYFTSTADRTNMMTKTHSDDLELISQLLNDKEKDLEMAARIGQSLLQRNKELLLKIEKMEEYLSETKDNEEQLKFDLKHKNELMRQYMEDDEQRSSTSSGSKEECDDEELKKLTRRCRMLEKENQELFNEALNIRQVTEAVEEQEEGLMLDCIEQLASTKQQITVLTDEIAQKFEDNVRQQEEITQLISMVVELQNSQKQLDVENEQLQQKLYEANENQETLQEQLVTMQEKFQETMNLLQENQEEMRLLKARLGSASRTSSDWSLEVGQSPVSFLQDSLATEIEESVKRDLFARENSNEQRRYNKKVLDNVRYLNVKQAESYSRSTSGRTSPVSNWSLASDERSETNSTFSHDTESTRPKKPAKKLQIVKPLEGSDTLNKWHHLASQNVKGGLNITSTEKSSDKVDTSIEDNVTVIDNGLSSLPDVVIDNIQNNDSSRQKTKPMPRNLKHSTPDEKRTTTMFSGLNTPLHKKRTIITRNSSALTSLRQGRKMLSDKEREGKSNVEVIDMIATAMSKVNLEAKTGQRILMSLAQNNTKKKRKKDFPHQEYKNMPHVNKALDKVTKTKTEKNEPQQEYNKKYSTETIVPKDDQRILAQKQRSDTNKTIEANFENLDLTSKVEYLHLDVKSQTPSEDLANEIDEDLNSVSGPLGLLNRAQPNESNDEIMNRLLRLSGQNNKDTTGKEGTAIRRNQSSGSLVNIVTSKRGILPLAATSGSVPNLISPLVKSQINEVASSSSAIQTDTLLSKTPPKQTSKSVESGLDEQKEEVQPNNQSSGLYGIFSFFGKLS